MEENLNRTLEYCREAKVSDFNPFYSLHLLLFICPSNSALFAVIFNSNELYRAKSFVFFLHVKRYPLPLPLSLFSPIFEYVQNKSPSNGLRDEKYSIKWKKT